MRFTINLTKSEKDYISRMISRISPDFDQTDMWADTTESKPAYLAEQRIDMDGNYEGMVSFDSNFIFDCVDVAAEIIEKGKSAFYVFSGMLEGAKAHFDNIRIRFEKWIPERTQEENRAEAQGSADRYIRDSKTEGFPVDTYIGVVVNTDKQPKVMSHTMTADSMLDLKRRMLETSKEEELGSNPELHFFRVDGDTAVYLESNDVAELANAEMYEKEEIISDDQLEECDDEIQEQFNEVLLIDESRKHIMDFMQVVVHRDGIKYVGCALLVADDGNTIIEHRVAFSGDLNNIRQRLYNEMKSLVLKIDTGKVMYFIFEYSNIINGADDVVIESDDFSKMPDITTQASFVSSSMQTIDAVMTSVINKANESIEGFCQRHVPSQRFPFVGYIFSNTAKMEIVFSHHKADFIMDMKARCDENSAYFVAFKANSELAAVDAKVPYDRICCGKCEFMEDLLMEASKQQ